MKPTFQILPRDRAIHPPALAPDYRSTRLRAPTRPLVLLPHTLSEATGPVFGERDIGPGEADLFASGQVDGEPIGERIVVFGQVCDEAARPLANTLIEVWQANAGGRYAHVNDGYAAALDRNFQGLGRCLTDGHGRYRLRTIKPGAYPWPNGEQSWRPSHIHFSLFGPTFASRLVTQMYFEGDPLIPLCPILNAIPDQEAINRLVAPLDMAASTPFDCLAYRFDIILRGAHQTPFENKLEGA